MSTNQKSLARFLPYLVVAVVALVAAALVYSKGPPFSRHEKKVPSLDPAQVLILRTPGGFLEVATLVKNEEFRWRSSYTCVWIDCGERIGQVRLPVHYTYRLRLAETWTLKMVDDTYLLSVPPPEPQLPPGIDISKAEFTSERGGLLAPSVMANREVMLKNLGPELAQRALKPEYLHQQMEHAEYTVREFAERWMREQGDGAKRSIRVEFRMKESN